MCCKNPVRSENESSRLEKSSVVCLIPLLLSSNSNSSSLMSVSGKSEEMGYKVAEVAEEGTDVERGKFIIQENISKQKKKYFPKVTVNSVSISEYEQLRERNIKERESALQASGLLEDIAKYKGIEFVGKAVDETSVIKEDDQRSDEDCYESSNSDASDGEYNSDEIREDLKMERCYLCGKEVPKGTKRMHNKLHHPAAKKPDLVAKLVEKCPDCAMEVPMARKMRQLHKRFYHPPPAGQSVSTSRRSERLDQGLAFPCPDCHQCSYRTLAGLQQHRVRYCTPSSPEKCKDCGEKVPRSVRKLHRRYYHPRVRKQSEEEEELAEVEQCWECQVEVPGGKMIQHHFLHHNPQIPHEPSEKDLRRAQRWLGASEKKANSPFECDQCGKMFTVKGNMANHIKKVHWKIKPHRCSEPDCSKSFFLKTNLQVHIDSVHKKIRVKCPDPECTATFRTKCGVPAHMRKKHGHAKLVCGIGGCLASFNWEAGLGAHREKIHYMWRW